MTRIFNFNAGPSMLPMQVLRQIKEELCSWNNLDISMMEISHRSKEFYELAQEAEQNLRELLNIPKNYKVLFCHGGARGQFSAIPMNLLQTDEAYGDYINTGFWSCNAAIESKKYCIPNIINVCYTKNGLYNILATSQWDISSNSTYVHYCPNETVEGISIHEDLNFCDKIIVADCSSMLLSRPMNVRNFGIIYAAAQKNVGISGLTIVIIREDLLLNKSYRKIPSILDYQILADNHSMFNTPVTISWYIANLIFKWLNIQGGLQLVSQRNQEKAALLYDTIDNSNFYYNKVDLSNRSYMNVSFFLKNETLNHLFLQESLCFGLYGLKGHQAIGGMRASLYNAMTLEGVQKLVSFMKIFAEKYS